MVLLDPQIADRYEVLDKIREGGMGAIYRVRHRLLDEVRVVKVIRATHPTPEARARFLHEARAATRLRHPNVAVLHDFAVAPDGNALIVLEYIEGWSLLELLREVGPPPLPLTLEIARQALKALGYLHRQSIVHRDISPDNLMLTRDVDGQPLVKLIDLGIAKALAVPSGAAGPAGTNRGLTTEGAFLGKPRYAAPEQFSGTGANGQSDLYSFAAVLYELLTGAPPVRGTDLASYMAAHLLQPPVPFEESDPEGRVPEELRAVVLQALAKQPADRPADAAAFARALTGIQGRHPLAPEDFEAVLAVLRPPAAAAELRFPGSTSEHIDRRFGRSTVAGAPALPADLPLRNEETRRVARLVPAETLTWRPPAPAAPAAAPEPMPAPGLEEPRPMPDELSEEAWLRWDLRTPEPSVAPPAPPAGEAAEAPGTTPEEEARADQMGAKAFSGPAADPAAGEADAGSWDVLRSPGLQVWPPEAALAVEVPFTGPAGSRAGGARGRAALLAAAAVLLVVVGGAGWQVAGRREAAAVAQATVPAAGRPEARPPVPSAPEDAVPALPPSPAPEPVERAAGSPSSPAAAEAPSRPAPPPLPAEPGELEIDGSGGPVEELMELEEVAESEEDARSRPPAGAGTPAAAGPAAAPAAERTRTAAAVTSQDRAEDRDAEEARTAVEPAASSPGREERSKPSLARKRTEPAGGSRRETPAASRETSSRRSGSEPSVRKEPAGTRTERRATERSRAGDLALRKPSNRDREPASSRAGSVSRPPASRPAATRPSSSSSSSYRPSSRPPRRGDFFLGGRDVSSPVPLALPRYDYPAAARGCGTASVRVALLIDEHGGVMEANVREGGPPGCGFDAAALAAARRTRFQPAYRGNVPGKMWTELIFDFVE